VSSVVLGECMLQCITYNYVCIYDINQGRFIIDGKAERKRFHMATKYISPTEVISPKQLWSLIRVLQDGGKR
jgi:hypothetical protein